MKKKGKRGWRKKKGGGVKMAYRNADGRNHRIRVDSVNPAQGLHPTVDQPVSGGGELSAT